MFFSLLPFSVSSLFRQVGCNPPSIYSWHSTERIVPFAASPHKGLQSLGFKHSRFTKSYGVFWKSTSFITTSRKVYRFCAGGGFSTCAFRHLELADAGGFLQCIDRKPTANLASKQMLLYARFMLLVSGFWGQQAESVAPKRKLPTYTSAPSNGSSTRAFTFREGAVTRPFRLSLRKTAVSFRSLLRAYMLSALISYGVAARHAL